MSYGFYFNADKCIGCRTCEITCKEKNDLEGGVVFRHVISLEHGVYPTAGLLHYSTSCHFCTDPGCLKACPMEAIMQTEEGVVLYDSTRCIACLSCAKACPFKVPQLSVQFKVAMKCNSCIDLRAQGRSPACVESCHMRCLDFGDTDQMRTKYGTLEGEGGLFQEDLVASPTHPSTIIVQKRFIGESPKQVLL